jgi:probable HAF family extracellular repeat protein
MKPSCLNRSRSDLVKLLVGLLCAGACSRANTITNLPTLGGSVVTPRGINHAGQIVGFSRTTGDAAQHAFLYGDGAILDLGTLGGSFSLASKINAGGQVIGDASTRGDLESHAFLFSGGRMLDLGTLGGTMSTATALNDAGNVVGDSYVRGDLSFRAFLYWDGTMTDLGTLGGSLSTSIGINSIGQVVGNSYVQGDVGYHAFFFSNGKMIDLGTLGGAESFAVAVNDLGHVAGESFTAADEDHAFLFSNGVMLDLGTLGGTYSAAVALNGAGQVIGNATTADDAEQHAFLHSGGVMRDLGTLGGAFSSATALNSRSQVVGDAQDAQGRARAFLWENGTMVDLNSLLPANSGWQLVSASFLNDAGQVVGFGILNGKPGWYLFTPSSANRPPTANAGPDQAADCAAPVVLDGSASADPDGDTLSYEWREGNLVLGWGATVTVSLPMGGHTISLTVTDPSRAATEDTLQVNVVDRTAPTLICPAPAAVAIDSNCQTVIPDLSARVIASDDCTAPEALLRTQVPASGTIIGPGSHPITVTVTDESGNSQSCTIVLAVADTMPPVVVCPEPLTVAADANGQALVPDLLATTGASDNCSAAEDLLRVQDPPAGVSVGLGTHSVTVTVTDPAGNSSSCAAPLVVVDTTPPTLTCPAPLTVSPTVGCLAVVPDLSRSVNATDNVTPASDLVVVQQPSAGTSVGLGAHTITVTATDAAGNSAVCTAALTVADAVQPVILSAFVTPTVLTPANHRLVDVTVSVSVADNCDSAPRCRIIAITSDEPVTGPGDPTSPDWIITGDLTAQLRAERLNRGDGRVYTLTLACTDASGNTATKTVNVTVPREGTKKLKRAHSNRKPTK